MDAIESVKTFRDTLVCDKVSLPCPDTWCTHVYPDTFDRVFHYALMVEKHLKIALVELVQFDLAAVEVSPEWVTNRMLHDLCTRLCVLLLKLYYEMRKCERCVRRVRSYVGIMPKHRVRCRARPLSLLLTLLPICTLTHTYPLRAQFRPGMPTPIVHYSAHENTVEGDSSDDTEPEPDDHPIQSEVNQPAKRSKK